MIDAEYAELLRQYLLTPTEQLRDLLHNRYKQLRLGGATNSGLPYPDPADPVAAGADAIRALAEAIEPRLPTGIAVGNVAFPSTASGARTSVEVTFPVGTFTVRPSVQITASSSAPDARPVSVSAPSAAGFIAVYANLGNEASGVGSYWTAISVPNSSVQLLEADAPADATATCTQDGCGNAGAAIPVYTTWLDDAGTSQPVTAFQCGVCGTALTPEGAS